MASLKDISKICGVSVATVSKALNDHKDIGEETKANINTGLILWFSDAIVPFEISSKIFPISTELYVLKYDPMAETIAQQKNPNFNLSDTAEKIAFNCCI